MKVKELIEALKTQDQEQDVLVWDVWEDQPTSDVHLSVMSEGLLLAEVDI
jgi:hypothetical protein